MVEATGLEPTTFWSLTRRATKLRYASLATIIILKNEKKANSFNAFYKKIYITIILQEFPRMI